MNRRRFIQATLAAIAAVSMRVTCQEPPAIVEEPPSIFFLQTNISEDLMREHGRQWAEHLDREIMSAHRNTK